VVNRWILSFDQYNPRKEGLREALCTLGNGYFATRGATPECVADNIHYPGTYLACGYNRLKTEISGHSIESEDLVNLPNWLPLIFRTKDGEWFDPLVVDLLEYRQELDMQKGILTRTIRFCDKQGRVTKVVDQRFVSMASPHLAAIRMTLTAENWSGTIEIRSALDGEVANCGVLRYRQLNNRHLKILGTGIIGEDTILLKTKTNQSDIQVAQAARTQVFQNGALLTPERINLERHGYIAQQFSMDIERLEAVSIEKVVSFYSSRDRAISDCGRYAPVLLSRSGRFERLMQKHVLRWDHLWRRFDMEIVRTGRLGENERTAMILHLHLFHLLQTISIHSMDMDVGIPARGWHGEAYRGHIFWDELFIFPLLNLRLPEITRSLLKYRYHRLREARAAAREVGFRGAMFPWQSGSTGREESQKIHLNPRSGRWKSDNSRLQHHVNSAIAYNIWRYYEATSDIEFLSFYGAEMILEIARFWASAATYNAEWNRYEIRGIMGPDEYHDAYPGADKPGLNNNAYTNLMAVWVLCRALDILEILPEDRCRELREALAITDEEVSLWDEISRGMRVVFHGNGIISQFENYDQLEEFDWQKYRSKYGNIQRLDRILEQEGDTPNRYKVSKQADVLMLFYLFSSEELEWLFRRLRYDFDQDTIPRNIDYYLERTSHGSTLSSVVHSWVLSRSNRPGAWQLFCEALESDIADVQGGTTPEGIHLGAMAGTLDFIQRGTTGIVTRNDVLWFNPRLPDEMERLHMQIRYRMHSLNIDVTHKKLTVQVLKSLLPPIHVGFRKRVYELKAGDTREFLYPESKRKSRIELRRAAS
jgi:alpha,alpha-trehalase